VLDEVEIFDLRWKRIGVESPSQTSNCLLTNYQVAAWINNFASYTELHLLQYLLVFFEEEKGNVKISLHIIFH